MSDIEDQPPPIPTAERPTWEILIETIEADGMMPGTVELLADMRERDRIGRERYGVPLQQSNGRDHLVDAAQEALDLCVYLAAACIKSGVDIKGAATHPLSVMLWDAVYLARRLRMQISGRA